MQTLEITNRCILCDNCTIICPEKAITKDADKLIIDQWLCTLCEVCIYVCPVNCIKTKDQ